MAKYAAVLLSIFLLNSCNKKIAELGPEWTIDNTSKDEKLSVISAHQKNSTLFLVIKAYDENFQQENYILRIQNELKSYWQPRPVPYPDTTTNTAINSLTSIPAIKIVKTPLDIKLQYEVKLNERKSVINNTLEKIVFKENKYFMICMKEKVIVETTIISPINENADFSFKCSSINR